MACLQRAVLSVVSEAEDLRFNSSTIPLAMHPLRTEAMMMVVAELLPSAV